MAAGEAEAGAGEEVWVGQEVGEVRADVEV